MDSPFRSNSSIFSLSRRLERDPLSDWLIPDKRFSRHLPLSSRVIAILSPDANSRPRPQNPTLCQEWMSNSRKVSGGTTLDSHGVVFEGLNDDSVDDCPGLRKRPRSPRVLDLSFAFPFHENLPDFSDFRWWNQEAEFLARIDAQFPARVIVFFRVTISSTYYTLSYSPSIIAGKTLQSHF